MASITETRLTAYTLILAPKEALFLKQLLQNQLIAEHEDVREELFNILPPLSDLLEETAKDG